MIEILLSKIHRATVNEANVNYEGSISISKSIIKEANILEYQKVLVADVNNGNRFETYVIASDQEHYICVNGAAANLVNVNDLVIIMAFKYIHHNRASATAPVVIKLNENNEIIKQ